MNFKIDIDISKIADYLNVKRGEIEELVMDGVRQISSSTQAFIIEKANNELKGFYREWYLGQNGEKIRWIELARGLWVVELDPSAAWIELGRPPTSMATEQWLLKPDRSKRAKDGSLYRAIPLKHFSTSKSAHVSSPALQSIVKQILRSEKIPITKIERNPDGTPKLGILHRLKIDDRFQGLEGFKSRPRSIEEAALSGLKPHAGIPYLQGAIVIQRPGPKKGIVKEVITFRTVSSKHFIEGRWMYPEVKPFNAFKEAKEWAEKEIEKLILQIEQKIRGE